MKMTAIAEKPVTFEIPIPIGEKPVVIFDLLRNRLKVDSKTYELDIPISERYSLTHATAKFENKILIVEIPVKTELNEEARIILF